MTAIRDKRRIVIPKTINVADEGLILLGEDIVVVISAPNIMDEKANTMNKTNDRKAATLTHVEFNFQKKGSVFL